MGNLGLATDSESTLEMLQARALDLGLRPPDPEMRVCVVVPARNEEKMLCSLVAALAEQRDTKGRRLALNSYEVLLLLNNCDDGSADVARRMQREYPALQLHIAAISFAPEEAHVGKARQVLFDLAFQRFRLLDRADGIILTTDSDTRPAPDWIAQNQNEIAAGVTGVGGRVLLVPEERAALPLGVRRFFLLDIGYRRALEELRSLYAPETHDPFPRHHQHFGASLAVTAGAYARAGGMPLRRSSEDVALYRALVESGELFRHSPRVQVYTSGRMLGRARGGLADAIGWWDCRARAHEAVMVESAASADLRFAALGRWSLQNPGSAAPEEMTITPENVAPDQLAEIQITLRALRERIEFLRPLPLIRRLALTDVSSRESSLVSALAA